MGFDTIEINLVCTKEIARRTIGAKAVQVVENLQKYKYKYLKNIICKYFATL